MPVRVRIPAPYSADSSALRSGGAGVNQSLFGRFTSNRMVCVVPLAWKAASPNASFHRAPCSLRVRTSVVFSELPYTAAYSIPPKLFTGPTVISGTVCIPVSGSKLIRNQTLPPSTLRTSSGEYALRNSATMADLK